MVKKHLYSVDARLESSTDNDNADFGFSSFSPVLVAECKNIIFIRPFPDNTNIDAAISALLTASQYKLQEDFI